MSSYAGPTLAALVRSQVPIVTILTRDEAAARDRVLTIARQSRPALPVFEWVVTQGLRRADVDHGGPQRHNSEPAQALAAIRDGIPGIYVLLDFHPYLSDPVNVRMLKDIALSHPSSARTVVLISHELDLPGELAALSAAFHLAHPTREERRAIVEGTAREYARAHRRAVAIDPEAVSRLVENLRGLPTTDTRRLARAAIFDDGAITASDSPEVMRAKYELINRGGVLSYEYETATDADLAGLDRLRRWLRLRQPAFNGSGAGLDPPRGVLLLGVQGCGKSLAAKAAAGVFGVPLLRLDLAGVHDKYVGESERRLREGLASADVLAPCVVWIDEIEKGLGTSGSDNGAAQRVLGTFLTWLAEKKGPVFVVATANNISDLPPELLRKGRFDEVFFVDLPTPAVRTDILALHARRRGVDLPPEGIARLAAATDGFSGAELEQAVIAAEYAALAAGRPVDTDMVLAEIQRTRPLSVLMAEQVAALRRWALTRTVPAD